ncbi:hypothetical protein [Taibaiella koreensis]|uniref:hypothetical protein n=1 Tax=Taibaiella koreensis TaxID=1268548 RepID=UPI000E59E266|nr:hypothetical protein [Taibaiella koreensis]
MKIPLLAQTAQACAKYMAIAGFLVLMLSSTGCRKQEQEATCDCDQLRTGLRAGDHTSVALEILHLTTDLQPVPTANDAYGQHDNLFLLADRMSRQCGFRATVLHYNGIETLPPQSEIRVADGPSFYKILDIGYDDQHKLNLQGMHE